MKIAILGTGKVGSALGTRLASTGHHVVYGSRTRAGEAGTLSPREAVASSDVVVTAIPGTAVVGALEDIGDEVLAEKRALGTAKFNIAISR
jgi:predicted dinucleotide-binding enzyme